VPLTPYASSVSARIEIGTDPAGGPITIDLQELLATRLLVQGNSGSGKSHLLRRLLEESAARRRFRHAGRAFRPHRDRRRGIFECRD
jgi:polynucleotide 5'-kinase involved in rRNA processing